MLHPYWYDKIASAEEAAALAAEDAMAEDAMAEDAMVADEDAAAAIEEDIAIAEAVSESDLPTEVKVAIMEDHDVAPEIIEEVINADAVEKVSSFYGINPYWLSDKLAVMTQQQLNRKRSAASPARLKNKRVNAEVQRGIKELDRASAAAERASINPALRDQIDSLVDRGTGMTREAWADELGSIGGPNVYERVARKEGLQEGFIKGQKSNQATIRDLRQQRQVLNDQVSKLSDQLGISKRQAAALLKKNEGLASELGATTSRLDSALSTISGLEGNLKASEALAGRYKQGIKNVGARNKQLLSDVAALQGNLAGKEKSLAAAAKKMGKMKGGLYGLGTLAALGLAGTGYGLYKANEAERPWYQKIIG